MSGADIKAVSLALSGANIESFQYKGQIAVTGRGREITQEDIARVHEAARAASFHGSGNSARNSALLHRGRQKGIRNRCI
jgi:cell division ATPase FtsA